MAAEENEAMLRHWVEEFWNKGNVALLDERIPAEYIGHFGQETLQGRDGFRQFSTRYRTGFPDIHFTLEDVIAQDDKVVWRYTARGTHSGELVGIPPTGKSVTMTGIVISRFAGSKFVEDWGDYDLYGMMQQLGVVQPLGS